jgi:glucosamine-6-phosphate deaminase
MNRSLEVRQLNKLTPDEVKVKAGKHLMVLNHTDEIYQFFADHMFNLIKSNNEKGAETVGVFPFGPYQQYPIFVERVNREKISLVNTHFFFVDEYADINGVEIPADHYLSLRGQLYKIFEKIDKELLPDFSKIIFPTAENLSKLKTMIGEKRIDVTYAGVGIHGHLAFNEPEQGVKDTDPRVTFINDFTVTLGAIRFGIGGDLENFPRRGLTLGMNQLLAADEVVLMTRSGIPGIDWANTVVRIAVLGEIGDDYPVTHIRNHKNWVLLTDEDSIRTPISI